MRTMPNPPLLIIYVIGLHMLWGIALTGYPENELANFALLGGFSDILNLFGARLAGLLIFSCALIAATGLLMEPRISRWKWPVHVLPLLPQYIVALLASLSSIWIIITSEVTVQGEVHHLDRSLLIVALGPLIISGVLHSYYVLQRLSYHPLEADVILFKTLSEKTQQNGS